MRTFFVAAVAALAALVTTVPGSASAQHGPPGWTGGGGMHVREHGRIFRSRESYRRSGHRPMFLRAYGRSYAIEPWIGVQFRIGIPSSYRRYRGGYGSAGYHNPRPPRYVGTRPCFVELSWRRVSDNADVTGHLERMMDYHCPGLDPEAVTVRMVD